jgi:hypothetical protein
MSSGERHAATMARPVLTAQETRPSRAWGLLGGAHPGASLTGAAAGDVKPCRWPYLAALGSWVVYSVAAVWMTIGLQYEIGDAMARTADARYMLFSRDPHLAAIGMYWMPLPVIGQLPFMLVLSPLHQAVLAGPLATAFAGALSVLVLARICRALDLSRSVAIGFTMVFALNPIMIWTAGNGMSEEWSYLGLLIALLGYVRWCKNHRSLDLATLAGGLMIVMLVRYETLALAPLMGVAAALNDGVTLPRRPGFGGMWAYLKGRSPRWLRVFAMIVLPTFYTFGLWTLCQYVIERNPFYWVKQSEAVGKTGTGYVNLPSVLTLHNIIVFSVGTALVICPALCVVGPLLVLRRRFTHALQGLGILAGALLWPAIVAVGLIGRESTGTTRYFEPVIVFITVGGAWLAADLRVPSPKARRVVAALLVGVLAISAIWSTAGIDNARRSSQEAENYYAHELIHLEVKALPLKVQPVPMVDWRDLARDLDPELAHGGKVLIDASVDFEAFVFTKHPDRYIVDSDRDYLQILADPTGRFNYLVLSTDPSKLGPRQTAFLEIISDTTDGRWVKWRSYPVADVYRLMPNAAGPG